MTRDRIPTDLHRARPSRSGRGEATPSMRLPIACRCSRSGCSSSRRRTGRGRRGTRTRKRSVPRSQGARHPEYRGRCGAVGGAHRSALPHDPRQRGRSDGPCVGGRDGRRCTAAVRRLGADEPQTKPSCRRVGVGRSLSDQVDAMAALAVDQGAPGLVCAASEVAGSDRPIRTCSCWSRA